jgi:hypothetical protein
VSRLLVLFESTHAVIKAERLCIAEKIPCKVIAVPRQISSDCGISIELNDEQEAAVAEVLKKNSIGFEFHRIDSRI